MERLELIPRTPEEETKKVEEESVLVSTSEVGTRQVSALDDGTRSSRRNPPARNTSRFWFERFLAVIQRQNPSLIDSSFLSQIAPNNEGKLLAQLKFLHLIDEQGRPTDLLPELNMVGAEQKKGFQQMIRESYGELLAEIVVEKAVADDVVNYYIRKYAFTRDKAVHATKFFLYLAEKGALDVSPELTSFLTEKKTPNGTPQSSIPAMPRIVAAERMKPARAIALNGSSSSSKNSRFSDSAPVQTVINIRLDKDTPREYWDRVLALAGERRMDSSPSPDLKPAQDGKENQ